MRVRVFTPCCCFRRILRVARFATLQMFSPGQQAGGKADPSAVAAAATKGPRSRVVDILAEGVEGNWTPATHLKIIKVGSWVPNVPLPIEKRKYLVR